MTAAININDYIFQIRFRVQQREANFRRLVNGLYGEAGVSGQTGKLVRGLLDALLIEFDNTIEELLTYFGKTVGRTSLAPSDMHQATVQELLNSALAFKATIDLERLVRFTRVERVRHTVAEELIRFDQMVQLRLREFALGLHDASPRVPIVPTASGYVTITHNQQMEVAGEFAELKEVVRGSNEAAEEDREIALYEIAVMEAAIVAPRVATDLIQRFIDGVLNWITSIFSTAVIAEVAQRLVQSLAKFL